MPSQKTNQDHLAIQRVFRMAGGATYTEFEILKKFVERTVVTKLADLEDRVLRIEREFRSPKHGRPLGKSTKGYVDPSRWGPEEIRALREDFGLSIKEMAFLLRVVVQSVHNWESGVPPKQEFLVRLKALKDGGKRRARAAIGKPASSVRL